MIINMRTVSINNHSCLLRQNLSFTFNTIIMILLNIN